MDSIRCWCSLVMLEAKILLIHTLLSMNNKVKFYRQGRASVRKKFDGDFSVHSQDNLFCSIIYEKD
jgi:hypothetical protein